MTTTAKRKRVTPRRSKAAASIAIKRVYDHLDASDGLRILVDRVWPRGVTKTTLKAHAWVKDLAPSTELRKWYQHDPERYAEFRRRYRAELKDKSGSLADLRKTLRGHAATLLTATRELELSHAKVLLEALRR